MIRKFAVLAVLGALAALALPASSMAGIYPPSSKFEITGLGKVETANGSCSLGRVTGQTAEQINGVVSVSVPPVQACTPGTSLTLSGSSWNLTAVNPYEVALIGTGTQTLKFTSLPGCKLTGSMALHGLWSPGVGDNREVSGIALSSTYHAQGGSTLTWANDGASCALAGKKEPVLYTDQIGSTESSLQPTVHTINDLSLPGAVMFLVAN